MEVRKSSSNKYKLKTKLKQWGNSKGVILPKAITNLVGINTGDEVIMSIEDGSIILTKAEPDTLKELTFEELFEGYSGEKFDAKIEIFEAVGKEEWA